MFDFAGLGAKGLVHLAKAGVGRPMDAAAIPAVNSLRCRFIEGFLVSPELELGRESGCVRFFILGPLF